MHLALEKGNKKTQLKPVGNHSLRSPGRKEERPKNPMGTFPLLKKSVGHVGFVQGFTEMDITSRLVVLKTYRLHKNVLEIPG